MLLDPARRGASTSRSDDVLAGAAGGLVERTGAPRRTARRSSSPPQPHADVAAAVARAARAARGAARACSSRSACAPPCAGTHPFALWEDVEVSPGARYQFLHASMRELARREPTFALHVHVAVPDPEQARARATTACARTCRCCSRCRPTRRSGRAATAAWPRRARRSSRPSRAPGIPRAFGVLRRLRRGDRRPAALRRVPRADVPVVGRAPAAALRHARGPRHGRADAPRRHRARSSRSCSAWCAWRRSRAARARTLVHAPEVLDENRFLAARDGMEARASSTPTARPPAARARAARRAARRVRAARRRARLRGRARVGARARARRPGAARQRSRAGRGSAPQLGRLMRALHAEFTAARSSRPCSPSDVRVRRRAAPRRRAPTADALRAHERRAGAARARRRRRVDHDGAGLAHRRLAIIDLSERGAQPMVDDDARPGRRLQRLIYNHRELRAELEAAGHAFRSTRDTEVLLNGWARVGRGRCSTGSWACSPSALVEHAQRRARARPRPARRQAAVPAELPAAALRFASTLPALLAARRRRHARRPRRAAPLPLVPLDRARAADDPARRAQAPARDGAGRRARRRAARAALLGPALRARRRARGLVGAQDWADAVHRGAARGGAAAHGRRRAGRGSCSRGGLDSSLIVALLAEQGQTRPGDVLGRLRRRRRPRGRRVRVLRPRGRASSAPTTTSSGSARTGSCARSPRAIAAMSEPMVSHDAVAFYLLSEEVAQHRKVVQSGPGRRRGVRRLLLVPAAARGARATALDVYARAFFDRDARGRARRCSSDALAGRGRPVARVRARVVRAAGRRDARSTAGCASTPRSCSSTTRSSASTT